MAHRRRAKLLDAHMLSPSVRSLTFWAEDGAPIGHAAGQYLDVIVPTPSGLPSMRAYSIASAPDASRPAFFELAVTRVEEGRTSDALHGMKPGAVVEIEGPHGTFVRRVEERASPALFVATGTGLAPIRAILTEEVRDGAGAPLVLLFGCRTPADFLWGDEITSWERTRPRLHVHLTLSKAPPEWTGLVGYVQRHARSLAQAHSGLHAYVCGVSAMVEDVVGILRREAGLAREAIHYETYD